MNGYSLNDQRRFHASYNRTSPNECWPWQRSCRNGYGQFRGPNTMERAHVVAYALAYGQVPADHEVHHTCENPRCVNPTHLRALTRAEHAKLHGNAAKTHCPAGHLYDDANTRRTPQGGRKCRACHREAIRHARRVAAYYRLQDKED